MAKRARYNRRRVASIGETEDTTIADIAVAPMRCRSRQGPVRSDRLAKYTQLLRIEEDLGDTATYPGRAASISSRRPTAMKLITLALAGLLC